LHQKELEKKRSHHKQEGSISKSELTSMISKGWREIDPDTKQYCENLAEAEKLKREQAVKSESNGAVAPTQPVTTPSSQRGCEQHKHLVLRPSSVTKSSNAAVSKQECCIPTHRAKPASIEARSKESVSTNSPFLPDLAGISAGSKSATTRTSVGSGLNASSNPSIDAEIDAALFDANLELFSDSSSGDDQFWQFDFSNGDFGEA
jgi:hypothetical protein